MKFRPSHRVPALLLACLLATLVFPRACDGTRTRVGALLPATAALGQDSAENPEAALLERVARLIEEKESLLAELDARPQSSGPLDGAEILRSGAAARTRIAVLAARVLHRDASTTQRSFLIDVGSDDGVYRGLPVVHGHSLVGIVSTVTAHACRVVRIDDVSGTTALPAQLTDLDAEAGVRRHGIGVTRGTGDGRLQVSFLARGEASVGDLVRTAAGRHPVPPGLVLGRVTAFHDDDRDGDWQAEVEPLRDLDLLTTVLVLLEPALPPEVAPR